MARQKLFEAKSPEETTIEPFQNLQKKADYAPCFTCKRHLKYPNVSPVTRHVEGICAICGKF